jgi:hypothetical protein
MEIAGGSLVVGVIDGDIVALAETAIAHVSHHSDHLGPGGVVARRAGLEAASEGVWPGQKRLAALARHRHPHGPGAGPREDAGDDLPEGMLLVVSGLALGLSLSVLATRWIVHLVVEVALLDASIYATVPAAPFTMSR